MTASDLDRIEAALRLDLPGSYRARMLDYPRWLADVQPEWSDVTRGDFADDRGCVVRFNQLVRDAEPGEFDDDGRWPEHPLVIGGEEEQGWYLLDLAGRSEAVFLLHHDSGEVRPIATSLDAFPDAPVEWWREVERRGSKGRAAIPSPPGRYQSSSVGVGEVDAAGLRPWRSPAPR